jgi:hypothetical protein
MSSGVSETEREDRKREYNRLAQREFRRRRKEHLKRLEQLQKEQSSDTAEEIERLKAQIAQLSSENDALRSQMYGGYGLLSPSGGGGPSSSRSLSPLSMAEGDLLPDLTSLDTASSISATSVATSPFVPSPALATHPMPSQESSMVVLVPYDRFKIRDYLRDLFAPIFDPAVHSLPAAHIETLKALSPMLPKQLTPTELQLRQPHFYQIDILPSPSLRDRLIQYGDDVARGFMKEVYAIDSHSELGISQITVWGEDPLNEMAWEISQPMLERWGFLLGREWFQRANFWRKARGAALLQEPDW